MPNIKKNIYKYSQFNSNRNQSSVSYLILFYFYMFEA